MLQGKWLSAPTASNLRSKDPHCAAYFGVLCSDSSRRRPPPRRAKLLAAALAAAAARWRKAAEAAPPCVAAAATTSATAAASERRIISAFAALCHKDFPLKPPSFPREWGVAVSAQLFIILVRPGARPRRADRTYRACPLG